VEKTPLKVSVLEAARARISELFDHFPNVIVSFSGGKDSGVLLNLAYEEAERRGRLPLHVLTLDLEAQYRNTHEYVERTFRREGITGHWVCLPLNLRNSVSQHQPFWTPWDPAASWVRPLPSHSSVVSDESYFPFFRRGMEFEEFVPAYLKWFVEQRGPTAQLVGIRADESLNRYRTIASSRKRMWEGKPWTTLSCEGGFLAYPIYDWRTEDIWVANGKFGWDYNTTYDLMHRAGLRLSQMRLCQPYGDDQRRGLWLFKTLEPDTWGEIVARVQGANFGSRHAHSTLLAHRSAGLPEGMTWEDYSKFLLETMPPPLAQHYGGKILTFLKWWEDHGYPEGIPDSAEPSLEAKRKVPSWRRIARVLLKNDYWCKGLSFSMTRREHDRRLALLLKQVEGS
jgi:predicted phosphoadenosine phosphosulfate sulfurtransferase